MPSPQEMTVAEAAKELGVTRWRIGQFIKEGRIRVARWVGPIRLVRTSDVLKLKSQERKAGRPRKKK
jgi:excisionase family DNA binding protein